MKVIITGTRLDIGLIETAIADFGHPITEVVCDGSYLSRFGEKWAVKNGAAVSYFPTPESFGIERLKRDKEMTIYADALILVWTQKGQRLINLINFAMTRRLLIYETIVMPNGTPWSRKHLGGRIPA